MGLPALKMKEIFTYGDYLKWDDNERWELIDGIAYNMSPAPSRSHQELVGELYTQINIFLKGKDCKAYIAPFDVRLPEANESDDKILTVVQPDISVICDKSKLDDRGCKGAPDWIIEIISPHTAAKDMKVKLALYEKHKVKEYWIVHPTDKFILVYRLNDNNQYSRPDVYVKEDVIECGVLKGLTVDLKELFQYE
ncbi:MAG: Uma2 family endonuclease [Thermodesulfovibrionales bacterium]|nr:Uma2 family endonuclease [Thermodesulfovibrionales bacterium]